MARLVLDPSQRDLLWCHLLPSPHELEEAAFLFARLDQEDSTRFVCEDLLLLGARDLAVQLPYYIELAEHVRPQVIKRAHDTGRIMVEAHSHLGRYPARFSKSDLRGFGEWVPHVRWRLKGSPYAAIVLAVDSYDGFVWRGATLERLDTIEVPGGAVMVATGLSPLEHVEEEDDE